MSELTEEQKKRIEENRQKALQRLAASRARREAEVSSDNSYNKSSAVSNQSGYQHANASNVSTLSCYKNQHSSGSTKTVINNFYNQPPSMPMPSMGQGPKQFKVFNKSAASVNKNIALPQAATNYKNAISTSSSKPVSGTFVLLSRKRFEANIGYHQQMIEIFKTVPSRMYNVKTKKWNFLIEHHDELVEKLRTLRPQVVFSPLSKNIIRLFVSAPEENIIPEYDLSCLDPVMLEALMPFQKAGVNFGIHLNGKVLIADDMGLGKTIQALGIANYYKADWPLLVVTPSSVKYSWAAAFETWLPSVSKELAIINSGKDYITNDSIVLISYDLLSKKKDEILKRHFKSVIFDESHHLKNPKSIRTLAAQQIMKFMKHIIMLSGTPALSRPAELFPQVSALNSREFSNYIDFAMRYCNAQKKPWGWDFTGSSNMEELQILLEETVMIRRLKSDVIKQLPPKVRQVILLDTVQTASKNKVLHAMSQKMFTSNLKGMEKRGVLLEYFHQTGITKLDAVIEYLKELLEADRKFLCFAHHQTVLDAISKAIEDLEVQFIRIDGHTPSEQRKVLCDKFQTNDLYKVAVLSITAANTGLTLTAAHLVVFAELFWNPGILTQAEDRAHRIGQEDSVIVQYLVAKGTADDEIWPLVQKKLDVLNKAGLSKDNFKSSETVQSKPKPGIEQYFQELDMFSFENENFDENGDDSPSKRPKFP